MAEPSLHESLTPFAWLLGTWRGGGTGIYPTIDDFTYEEELHFWHSGKPVMAYSSRTASSDDGRALPAEMGYWRPPADGSIEVVIAHSFGLTEIMRGRREGSTLVFESVSFESTPTAKLVEAERRVITRTSEGLSYEMEMDFGGHGLQNHLRADLRRVETTLT